MIGGLGGAIAEFKATQAHSPRQIFIGFNDEFTKAGSQRYIWDLVGLTSEKIAKKIYEELGALDLTNTYTYTNPRTGAQEVKTDDYLKGTKFNDSTFRLYAKRWCIHQWC